MATSKAKPFVARLLVRPSPLKGESLRGYLLRVGERNGCGKGANLFSALSGQHGSQCLVSDQTVDAVAQALDIDRELVAAISYRPAASDVKGQCLFFGHAVSVNHLRSRNPAVCPDCLSELQAISGLWDLRAVCACPRHGKWLIDRCPECGDALKWNRSRVASCQCGFDLRRIETRHAPPDVLALTALIHEIALNDLPVVDERSLGYPDGVRTTPLNELLGLCRFTAEVLVPGHPVAREVCADGSDTFRKQSQGAALMARVLTAWPEELSLAIAEHASFKSDGSVPAVALSAKAFNSRFGRLLNTAIKPRSFCLKVPDFFKQALLHFRKEHRVTDTDEGRYLNPAMVWRASDGQRVLTFEICAGALGGHLKDASKKDEVMLFSTYLDEKATFLSGLVTLRAATQRLGCSPAQLKALSDSGLLSASAGGDLDKNEMAELVPMFERAAIERKHGRPLDLLSLISFKPADRAAFFRLVRAIAKKEVSLYKEAGSQVTRLSQLGVSIAELRRTGHWIWAARNKKAPG